MKAPKTPLEWVTALLGAFALTMGLVGLWSPERQAALMGFPAVSARAPGDHTLTLLSIVSLATINTALLYLVAVARRWSGFAVLAVVARSIMGAGLLVLALTGRGPSAFISAAIWEWAGAVLLGALHLRERRAT